MRNTASWLTIVTLFGAACVGQQAATPQTARQALMEMFFSKTPGTFVMHLPVATREAFVKSGATANLPQYSLIMSQLEANGKNFQTFETGSVLLAGTDPKTGQKTEITVVSDVLRGDHDDIEVSFQTYKDGQPQRIPFMPHMTFSMKQEAHVWKLFEISVNVHVPLADPDVLKAFTESMQKAHTAAPANASFTQSSEPTMPPAGTDAQVLAAMRTILTAEVTYAATYPNAGFTCTLSDLDGFGGGEPNEHQAMLINSGLASGRKYGYVFGLSGCGVAPAKTFRLSAVTNSSISGRKAFCADQSAVIRSSDDGNAANCFAHGTPVQ